MANKFEGATYQTGFIGTAYDGNVHDGVNSDGTDSVSTGSKFTYYRSLAVNPDVIPYGSVVHVYVPDAPEYSGVYLAEDTGGAIKRENGGKRVDLGMPYDIALKFGRRPVEIAILEKGTGERVDARSKAERWMDIAAYYGNTSKPVGYESGMGTASGAAGGNSSTGKMKYSDNKYYFEDSNLYDKEVWEGISGLVTKPTFMPPNYYEDDFSQLPYRYTQGDYFLRLGDTRFVVPPTMIKVSETNTIQKYKMLRQKQSMKTSLGNKTKMIEMTLYFTDFDQINGYEMNGPGGDKYYMDGLRSLIAQMKTMPFLPIENELLNFTHHVYSVAILSAYIQAEPGFPGVIRCELTLIENEVEAFLNKPSFTYDQHFVWPLFRWHYQRFLNSRTKEPDVLAPFIGDDAIDFFYLDEGMLLRMDAEVKQDALTPADEDNTGTEIQTWWDFNDTVKGDKMFIKHDLPHDYSIVDISASTGTSLTPLTPQLIGKPTFQYFGSQDTRFQVLIHTTNRAIVESMQSMKDTVDRYAREYRNRFVSSMLRVQNNFVNMLGVTSCMIESLHVQTDPGFPNSFYINLSLISFDETQYRDETVGHLSTFDLDKAIQGSAITDTSGKKRDGVDGENLAQQLAGGAIENYDNNIIHAVAAEEAMDQMELYPDLGLPTYDELNEIIPKITDWRELRGLSPLPNDEMKGPDGAIYVDPDFYFSYPSLEDILAKLKEAFSDPYIREISADYNIDLSEDEIRAIEEVDIGDLFGAKVENQIEREDPGDVDQLKQAHAEFNASDINALKAKIDELRLSVHDPAQYVKRFWVKAWHPVKEKGGWEFSETQVKDGTNSDWVVAYYKNQKPVATVATLQEEDIFKGTVHDMYKYDKRGTMMRAFPSYVFLIIDEGRYVNVRKLWDNFYTYHAISEINVHMDKKNPMHTAYIKLSNVYGALTNQTKFYKKLENPGIMDMIDSFFESFTHDFNEKEIIERTAVYDSIELLAGARIHIRMGYGSAASQLPPVFNGVIAEINTGDMVEIVAQSYGYELTNELPVAPGEDNTPFEQGLESTELFRYYMTHRRKSWVWAWRDSGEAEHYQSAYGIEHFGYLRIRDEQTLGDLFALAGFWLDHEVQFNIEDYDVMKNIYSTKRGAPSKEGADEDKAEKEKQKEKTKGGASASRKRVFEEAETNPVSKEWGKEKPDIKVKVTTSAKRDVTDSSIVGPIPGREVVHEFEAPTSYKKAKKIVDTLAQAEEEGYKISDSDKKKLIGSVYWWAASPDTKTGDVPVLSKVKWDADKKSENDKAIEKLLGSLEKTDKDVYEGMGSTLKTIAEEWRNLDWGQNDAPKTADEVITDAVTDMVTGESSSEDEPNIRMQLEGKTPWDVFRVLERVNPEYVVYPHVHQFGYTLFFGKPWWDVQYGYTLPPLSKGAKTRFEKETGGEYGKRISDYVEMTKPFSQVHFYTGYGDILGNNIKASGRDLITVVTPLFHMTDKPVKYDNIWADYYISGSFQRAKLIDTTLVQDSPWIPNIFNIENIIGAVGTKVTNLFDGETAYQKYAMKFSTSVIAESFKDMYQGELVVMGDPSAKPYDVMYIDDPYTRMSGTADIGAVTHLFSVETGFISTIKPDLSVAVNPEPSLYSEDWSTYPDDTPGDIFRYPYTVAKMGLNAVYYLSLYKIARYAIQKHNLERAMKLARFLKLDKTLAGMGAAWTRLLGSGTWINNTLRNVPGVSQAAKLVRSVQGIKRIRSIASGIRLSALNVAGRAAAAPGVGGITATLAVIGVFASQFLLTNLTHLFLQKHNNVIKIFPLFYDGVPYVAGINGHKQLIAGWEDNGGGRPLRVDYENRPEILPMRYADIMNDTETVTGGGGGPISVFPEMDVGSVVSNIPPSSWAQNIDGDVTSRGPMFYFPIVLGSEGEGFPGLKKRVTRGKSSGHNGIDFFRGAPNKTNDANIALAAGRVVYAGASNGFGFHVIIKHVIPQKGGQSYVFFTGYGHMYPNECAVKTGWDVVPGQYLGKMGDNGQSQGRHLHWDVYIPRDMKKALEVSDGRSAYNYIMAGSSSNRTNVIYADGLAFIEGILNANAELMKYKKFQG